MSSNGNGAELESTAVVRFLVDFAGRKEALTFLLVILAMSFLDLVGIAVIFPYIQIISDPDVLFRYLSFVTPEFFAAKKREILLIVSGVLAIAYLAKGILQGKLLRFQHQRLAQFTARLTNDTVSKILTARYSVFQEVAGSEIAGVAYVNTVHSTITFRAIVQAANEVIFLALLSVTFMVFRPVLTITVLLLLCAVILLLYYAVVHRTLTLGKTQSIVENIRYRLLFSITNAIRDIKVMGLGDRFDAKNREVSNQYAEIAWRYNYNGALPLLLIELVVLIAVIGAVSVLILAEIPTAEVLPLIGVAAVTTVRAVPAFGKLLMSLNAFRFSRSFVEKLIRIREQLDKAKHTRHVDNLHFRQRIEVRGVSFDYGNKAILRNINMDIIRGEAVGIVGLSGSGKSTLLDIITGLQPAKGGHFACDGKLFDPFNSASMEQLIGYVPQSLTMLDETIAFNIAFEHDYDSVRLEKAIRIANLESFIRSLDDGIDTVVGENGLRVSGGQRQRIGIARALYREPAILVFDEATSALDAHTERELTSEIARLRGEITLLVVSHQLSAVMKCDDIYVLCDGVVADHGTHQELIERCRLYRELYELQNARQRIE